MLTPEEVREKRATLCRKRRALLDEVDEIAKAISALKKECPHRQLHYNPDPSGNNDSHWDCSDCGGYFDRCPT